MKVLRLNKYTTAAIFLFATSAVLVAIALLSDLGDTTKAAFVISGMVCATTGIFTLTFSQGEPVDPNLVGILPAQGSLNFSYLLKNLGIHGNAYFLPPRITGKSSVLQFNPTSSYDGRKGSEEGSFKETLPVGFITPPSCDLLIQDLRNRNALVIPDTDEELSSLVRETIENVYKFAPRVSVEWDGSKVDITFHKYPYIEGCTVIAQKSPDCCAMSPCPACSLCGTLIAEGSDRVVMLDRCSVSSSSHDIIANFSILPLPDRSP
jgi:hypothetical protein